MEAETIALEYGKQSCSLSAPSGTFPELLRLVESLRSGATTPEELRELCPDVDALVLRLDTLGLLTEGRLSRPEGALTGPEFFKETIRFRENLLRSRPTEAFFSALEAGTVGREVLIGYALEYFHIVNRCPAILAPALANHESRATERLLRAFYRSEFDHDTLLRRSLGSVGFTDAQLDAMLPLPTTFAVYSALAVYARQHPLSFKCALFIFEEPALEFHDAFVRRCRELDLPEAFYAPIVEHAEVNDGAAHERISGQLLAEISSISQEDQLVALKHVGTLCENLLRQEREILAYYGDSGARVPRVWGERVHAAC